MKLYMVLEDWQLVWLNTYGIVVNVLTMAKINSGYIPLKTVVGRVSDILVDEENSITDMLINGICLATCTI